MRDKRPVDEIPVDELERILTIRKREQRMARVQGYRESGRSIAAPLPDEAKALTLAPSPIATMPESILTPKESLPRFDDEDDGEVRFIEDRPVRRVSAEEQATRTRTVNRLLLLVEIAAVAGLAIVLYLAFTGLNDIQSNTNQTQQELAAIREQGRITPTPYPELSPASVIIPGGHTPYDANGESFFNYVELEQAFDFLQVPQSVRPALTQKFTPALMRKPSTQTQRGPGDPYYLDIPEIPKIRQASIARGADWETLREGVGWLDNGAQLGTHQNVVLVGHNDVYGEIFRDLPLLEIGDEITVLTTNQQRYTYRVTGTDIVEPHEVWVLDRNSGAHLTLITCYPYQVDTQRYIVFAELAE